MKNSLKTWLVVHIRETVSKTRSEMIGKVVLATIILLISTLGIPTIINEAYKYGTLHGGYIATWDAADVLSYCGADTFDDIDPGAVKRALESSTEQPDSPVSDMVQDAQRQAADYDEAMKESGNFDFFGGELGDMLNQNAIQPQFSEEAAAFQGRE